MNKSKLIKKDGAVRLVIKSLKGQQLDAWETDAIKKGGVRGLLAFDVEKKPNSFKLIYNLTGFITLREFLKNPLNKKNFLMILHSIVDNQIALQEQNFRQERICLDFDHVMVNPATQELWFVYLPIQACENGVSLRSFLQNIISVGYFAADEDSGYVEKYISIINDGINLSVFSLQEYVRALETENQTAVHIIKCPKCRTEARPGAKFCSACGCVLSESGEDNDMLYYDPYKNGAGKESGNPYQKNKGNTQHFTTVLGAEEQGKSTAGHTSVLGMASAEEPVYPYLMRDKSGERISIDKPNFRIGTEREYCDYFVCDNTYVSRSHANIITRNKRYYVVDLNSSNHTYVDGRVIVPQREEEIFHGTKIRLGNEEFTFYIED